MRKEYHFADYDYSCPAVRDVMEGACFAVWVPLSACGANAFEFDNI